ncbi:MAG: isopenicillin N synthase family oxygenase [Bdellovibrionaceae bacterium]|nr:isopenicillin N synthase family oxygenase [Pseudobdellovibrionaceae bacterium]
MPNMNANIKELSLHSYLLGSAEEKQKFSEELFEGLQDAGFVIIKNHSVPVDLLLAGYKVLEKFFALSEEEKKQYIYPQKGGLRGYTPVGIEHAKDSSIADLKEFWHVGQMYMTESKHILYPENIWPNEKQLADFKIVFTKIYSMLENIGQILLRALSKPLEVDERYFDNLVQNGNSILRLLHYPPIADNIEKNAVRAGAHEDINFITLLAVASASGLEILDKKTNQWLKVESSPNDLILNVGDMMARITNNKLPATTHRVVNPQTEKNTSRYSIPFFMHPKPSSILSCLPSCKKEANNPEDISAGDFLMQRLKAIGLYQKQTD